MSILPRYESLPDDQYLSREDQDIGIGNPTRSVSDGDHFRKHSEPKRKKVYCGCLSKRACTLVSVFVTVLLITAAVLVSIFIGGAAFAQVSLDRADLTMTLTVLNFTEDSIYSNVHAVLDNRNTMGANLQSSTLYVEYESVQFASFEFPAMALPADTRTILDLNSTLFIMDKDMFSTFCIESFYQDQVSIRLSGQVSVSAFGLSFSSLRLQKDLILEAMGNFTSPGVSVSDVQVSDGIENEVTVNMQISIPNPSHDLSFKRMDRLNLHMYYDDVYLGVAIADEPVPLGFGNNVFSVTAQILRTVDSEPAIRELLSGFVQGQDSVVEIRGHANSTNITLMKDAVAALRISSIFPALGPDQRLFQAGYTVLDVLAINNSSDPVACYFTEDKHYTDITLMIYNPMHVPLNMVDVDFTSYWEGMVIGRAEIQGLNVVLPPLEVTAVSQRLCLSDDPTVMARLYLYILQNGLDRHGIVPFILWLRSTGAATVQINDFRLTNMGYSQDGIMSITRYIGLFGDEQQQPHNATAHTHVLLPSPSTTAAF